MESSLLIGSPYKKIIRFTIPLLIGNLIQQFYYAADAYIVSRNLGINAFAGISSTNGIVLLVIGFIQGMTVGLSNPIARYFGANDLNSLRKHYASNFFICILLSFLLTLISFFTLDGILHILRTPQSIERYARDFLQIIFLGIFSSVYFNLFANTLRALGNSKTPLYCLAFGAVLNIFLDIILITFTPLGIRGAALATVVSQFIAAILCLMILNKRFSYFQLKGLSNFFEMHTAIRNVKFGFSIGFQSSIIALGVVIMQFSINGLGADSIAAFAVAARIESMAVEPLRSFGMAMTTFTAQNYGAKQYNRILKGVRQCLYITIGFSIFLSFIMNLFGKALTIVFVGSSNSKILELSHDFLVVHGYLYVFLALLFTYRFTLQGLGQSVAPTISSVMELTIRILSATLLVPYLGFTGVIMATPLSWLGALIPSAISYYFNLKKFRK